jgi:selenide,water dikinase
VVGGHTVDDPEPKAGYAVIGTLHPDHIISNATGRPGDILVLTKPLGSGILSTAIKQGRLDQSAIDQVVEVMAELNKSAADAMLEVGVNSCTDVTGFGLLGHLHEMAKGSGLAAHLDAGAVPILPRVLDLIAEGVVPGGTRNNEGYMAPFVEWDDAVGQSLRTALADAQTSGGLVIAVEENKAAALIAALKSRGTQAAARIGRLVEGPAGTMTVGE